MTEQERFYHRANTWLSIGQGFAMVGLGYVLASWIGRPALLRAVLAGMMPFVLLYTLHDDGVWRPDSSITDSFTVWTWLVVVAFICLVVDAFRCYRRFHAECVIAAQQYEAQVAEYNAQQAAPAQTAQRVTRTVTVTRAPVRNDDAQQRSQGTTGTSPRRSEPRPVRSIEQHGNLRITDRRPFDPELGE